MKKYGIVFDLDDTLVVSSPIYYSCLLDTIKLINEHVYPDFYYPGDLIAIFHEIEERETGHDTVDRVAYEYSLGDSAVFARELANFYCEAMLRKGKVPTEAKVSEAYRIGLRIFKYNYRFAPGARALLHYLSKRIDVIPFVLTLGSPDLQEPKVRNRELFKVFDRVTILPFTEGKETYLKELMQEYDDIDEWMMVGDNVNSDINPALSVGILACHVTRLSSHKAYGDLIGIERVLERYKQFPELTDFTEFLKRKIADDAEKVQVKQRA